MTKRFGWILVGLVIGLATGGIAYAVVVNPPSSTDRYYACVSNVGVVRAGTVRLNAPPIKCPNALDQIHSWNAAGSTGPTGATGVPGVSANRGQLFTLLAPTSPNRWVVELPDVPAGMYMLGLEAYVAGGTVSCTVAVVPNAVWPVPKALGNFGDTGVDPARSYRIMRSDVDGDVTFVCDRVSGTPVSMDGTAFAIRVS